MDTTLPSPAPLRTDLVRTALVDRVRAARPAILSLVAPAGFGKSTLARQLLDGTAFAICDCRGVGSDGDLARRVVPALADEDPERSGSLSQSETMLGDGHTSAAERVEVALAAWRVRPRRPSPFIFENAEDAIADPGARDFLAKLLAARPDGRTIVICSRESLRMHLSRFAAPHQILGLRAADLAFTRDEIAAIFGQAGASAEAVERVAVISGGWPIAVLLLARFAQERRLDALLDKLDDVAYEELHEYLAEQVLGDAPAAVIDGILACAAIPNPTERDVRLALGPSGAFAAFDAFTKSSPFITRGDDAYAVHPLVATTFLERYPARVDALLAPAAAAYEKGDEFQRAAEIHLARGDQRAAAAALERIEIMDADLPPPIAYARVLASLDRAVVLRCPRLWSVTALLRTFTVDSRLLLDEVESIWSQLPADAPPVLRIYLYVFRVLMLSYVGEFETALRLVDEFRAQIAAPEIPQTRIHGWLLFLRSLMTARLGRTQEAERDLEAAWPLVSETSFLAGGVLVTLGADIARVRGDRATERERLDRAIEIGRKTGFSNFIAFYECEATFGAWLAGDEADFLQHAYALEAEVEGARGFAFFSASARGHAARPQPVDQPKWVAAGNLILAAAAPDDGTALRYADTAREAAATSRSPFYLVLTALAVAELNPARRRALRAEAATTARRIDAVELHEAVDALARGEHGGFLEAFARRFRRRGGAETQRGGLTVELVTGRVLRDGAPVTLAEREHALLAAIAMRAEPLSRDRLTDLLWPDLPDSAARNAFHVCLHRLKARLGDDQVVIRTREGYRLGNEVRVDLWEIDRALGALRTDEPDARRIAGLRALYERLRPSRPPKFEAWEWFEPTERHLREMRCDVAQALAKHALDEGRTQDALVLCHEMIAYDPCDEPAREIAIRAYLESGDRAAALRHFRQYRDVLHAELQCEPSASLATLVGAGT